MSYFILYNLSRDRISVNFFDVLQYLFTSVSLLAGQFSGRSTAALPMSRSCSTSSQSSVIWSIVCSLYCRNTLGCLTFKFVKICLNTFLSCFHCCKIWSHFTLKFYLSAILSKNDFVIAPIVVLSHSPIHFVTRLSIYSLLTVFLGILL